MNSRIYFLLFLVFFGYGTLHAQEKRYFIDEIDSFYLSYPVNYSCGETPEIPILKAVLCDCQVYDEKTSPPCITVSVYNMEDSTDFSNFVKNKITYLKNGEFKKSVKTVKTEFDTISKAEFSPVYGKEKLKSEFVWIKRNNTVIEFFFNDNEGNYKEHKKDFDDVLQSFKNIHYSCKDGSIAKEGVFKKSPNSNDSIVKKEGIHTEYFGNGEYVKAKIEWVNNCEFVNKFIDSNMPEEILVYIREDMTVKIIEEDENSYTCIWQIGGLKGIERYIKIR